MVYALHPFAKCFAGDRFAFARFNRVLAQVTTLTSQVTINRYVLSEPV